MSATAPLPEETDSELLRRAQSGDEAAFGAVMKANYERTFRLVYSIVRNEADARDLCQEIWVKVWSELPKFRGDSKFSTWLHTIATRRSLDHLRKNRRWFDKFLPFSIEDAEIKSVPEPSTEETARDQTEGSERVQQLKDALDTLPPKMRAVLALREIEGLSYEEIAKVSDLPTGTVMSRLYHARRLLAQKLGAKP
ncbi:RNA polymerase sigma factor [Oleiharenicola lentus]|uniref:RNA polymerase sigma factor n=1 Tax=Oleiharenicola lentus TaxID=2508720 RepID=UPI003F67FF6B